MERNVSFKHESSSRQEQDKVRRVSSYQLKKNYRESISESIQSDVSAMAKFNDFKDVLIEVKTMRTSEQGIKNMRLYDSMKIYRQICFLAMLILAFFERPVWCTNHYSNGCQMTPDGIKIPTSTLPIMSNYIFYPIEAVIVSFLTLNRYVKQKFLRSKKSKYWFYFLVTITVFILIEDFIKSTVDSYHINLSLFLKPIYFISFKSTLQIYFAIIKRVLPIFLLIMVNILFFSFLGRIIFYDLAGDSNYFNSLFDTMFNLTVLQTTSNFPDVMMSFYNQHRWAPFFFICFLIINLFILLNTVLGVFYSSYKQHMEKDTKRFFLKNQSKVQSYIHKFMKTKNVRAASQQNNQILSNFMKINQGRSAFLSMLHENPVDIEPSNRFFKACKDITKIFMTSLWGIFIGCLGLFNFLVLYLMVPSVAAIPADDKLDLWVNLNFFMNLVFFTEQFIFLLAGRKQYFKDKWYYVLDFFISIIIIILIGCYWITGNMSLIPWAMYLICSRIFRFFRLMMRFESIKTLVTSIYDFVPLFVNLFGVLIVMFFFFAALGQHIFGGHMTYAYEQQINEETGTSFYILNCFNDMGTSLVLLFELLIVNNWMVNVQTHQIIMGTKLVRFFFIAWYIVAVLVCMNIMIAFIIDNLVNKFSDNDESEDQKFGENLLPTDHNLILRAQTSKSHSAQSAANLPTFQASPTGGAAVAPTFNSFEFPSPTQKDLRFRFSPLSSQEGEQLKTHYKN